MNKHKTLITLSDTLFVLAVAIQASIITFIRGWNSLWEIAGFFGVVISAIASIIANSIPSSASYVLATEDWIEENSEWRILIKAKKHGLGKHSMISTYKRLENGNYEPIVFSSEICLNGDIILKTNLKPDYEIEAIITYIDNWKN